MDPREVRTEWNTRRAVAPDRRRAPDSARRSRSHHPAAVERPRRRGASMVRFFLAIRPFPAYALAGLLGVTVFGMISVSWSPEELDSALGLLLFVQMFLASS